MKNSMLTLLNTHGTMIVKVTMTKNKIVLTYYFSCVKASFC